jgi:hypothetical protein
MTAGNGPLAPREKRVGYASARLQNVVQVSLHSLSILESMLILMLRSPGARTNASEERKPRRRVMRRARTKRISSHLVLPRSKQRRPPSVPRPPPSSVNPLPSSPPPLIQISSTIHLLLLAPSLVRNPKPRLRPLRKLLRPSEDPPSRPLHRGSAPTSSSATRGQQRTTESIRPRTSSTRGLPRGGPQLSELREEVYRWSRRARRIMFRTRGRDRSRGCQTTIGRIHWSNSHSSNSIACNLILSQQSEYDEFLLA